MNKVKFTKDEILKKFDRLISVSGKEIDIMLNKSYRLDDALQDVYDIRDFIIEQKEKIYKIYST